MSMLYLVEKQCKLYERMRLSKLTKDQRRVIIMHCKILRMRVKVDRFAGKRITFTITK